MTFLRATLKLVSFLISTLLIYSLILIVQLAALVGLNHEALRSKFLNFWGKSCCKIIGMKIEVKGDAPKPPFFLVSNHLSYIDVFLLFSQVRGLFVAKSDVKQWPVIGFIVKTCGILFIDRNRKRDITRVNQLISKNINKNQGVIVFPESRTSPGIEILPFRSSLLQTPATMQLPVSYAVISYSTEEGEGAACKTICWWDDDPFLIHFFNLLKLKKFTATITFGEEMVTSSNRKELTQTLENLVKESFIPVIKNAKFEKLHPEYDVNKHRTG